MLWGLDTETGRVAWFAGQSAPEAITHGRAAIAGGHVYWPRREEILMVETAGGRVRRQIDLKNQHGIPGGGNITLVEGGLILAQADRLSFFSEYGRLRKIREDQLSQHPSDPFKHLALARVAEALHEWPRALASYEHVAHAGDDRERIFGQSLTELAVDRRAKIQLEQNAPELAIAEWQTLLDSGLDSPVAVRSRQRARQEISRLLAMHGDAAREPFERAAEEEIQEAIRRRDLHALRRAIIRNSHSRSASRGRLALAELQHAAGDSRSADESRSTVLRSEMRGEMHAVALAGMALSAEERGHWSSAARLWQTLYDSEPLVPIQVGNSRERPMDVVPRRLQTIRERERGTGAVRSDPIIRQWECALRDGEKPLIVEGASPASALGCVLVSGPDVICRSTADGDERWRLPVAESVHWAGFSGGLLVLGSRADLMAVAPEDGAVVWHQRLSTANGSQATAREVSFHAVDDRVYCLATDVGLSCFSSARGELCWSAECRWPSFPRTWHCGKNWIVVPSPGLDGWLIWNTRDADLSGAVARAPGGLTSAPVVVGDWLGLSDERAAPRVVKLAHGTLTSSTYQGPLLTDAGDAQFVSGETALVAMIDGTTLVRVDPASGKPLWSCRGGPTSPGLLRPAVCLDDRRVHSISCGIARSVSLDDGQFLWEKHIGSAREEWRVERTGPWLALMPAKPEKSSRLTLCDPATGELVARIPCGGRSASARLVAENDRFVLATDSHLTGYRLLADGDE
jgi:outer membrane protein assembly factor BamB